MKRVVTTLIHSDGTFVTLEELEADAIEKALLYYGSRIKAHKALGISRTQLYKKMEKYGLEEVIPHRHGPATKKHAKK